MTRICQSCGYPKSHPAHFLAHYSKGKGMQDKGMVIELHHPTDPRYLMITELPERVSLDDLSTWRYGKAMISTPETPAAVYTQPEGLGTDWVKPS